MKRTCLILMLVPLLCLGITPPLYADIASFSEAVNKAGQQRMLTQRITKTYSLIGVASAKLAAVPTDFEFELLQALHRFETQLEELQQFNQDKEVAAELQQIQAKWPQFKKLALSSFSQENSRLLWQADEQMLRHCESVMRKLLQGASNPVNQYVNISGRTRMLSQRIAKIYMLRAIGLEAPGMLENLGGQKSEFEDALAALESAEENTVVIKSNLDEVRLQWRWLVGALELDSEPTFPIIVNDAGDKVLQVTERLTTLYEELARHKLD